MKKYILFLIVLITAVTSCSNDNNNDIDNNSSQSLQIWMGQNTGSTGNFSNLRWMIVLPNGEYFNQLPTEGFLDFSRNQTGGTWGTFSMNGSTGTISNQYETFTANKISDTEIELVGYTNHIYKLASVDGVKLMGQYVNGIPNWSTSGNYPYGINDAQPMIEFSLDGNFIDKGAFVTNFSMPYQNPDRAPGNGTYTINKYTLILNYSDGRKITKAFSGVLNNQVNSNSELVLIGGNPFYNN